VWWRHIPDGGGHDRGDGRPRRRARPPPHGDAHRRHERGDLGTRDGDNQRTGWYPGETNLTPSLVAGGTFGQLFNTTVNGAVYGQPLVDDGQLLVNTENNYAYGLDPVSGAILWTRQFGSPPQASDIGCADLAPTMASPGPRWSTRRPTPSTWWTTSTCRRLGSQVDYMHALNLANGGAEEPGFPVQIAGPRRTNRRRRSIRPMSSSAPACCS